MVLTHRLSWHPSRAPLRHSPRPQLLSSRTGSSYLLFLFFPNTGYQTRLPLMFALVFLTSLPLLSSAIPLVGRSDGPVSTDTPTPVSAQDIAENFVRPAHFSQLAYCSSNLVKAWNCGQSCQAMQMGGFNPLTVGGTI